MVPMFKDMEMLAPRHSCPLQEVAILNKIHILKCLPSIEFAYPFSIFLISFRSPFFTPN